MIGSGLRLAVSFDESLTVGRRPAGDALMDCFERHEPPVAALYRSSDGLVAEAIDTRERIQSVLGEVESIVDRGLVTLEPAHLVVGDDVRAAAFPGGVGSAARLTIYCGRGERTGRVASYRAVVDLLRRHGGRGAIVLLGVDGMHGGARRRAGLFSRNAGVPMATIAVGAPDVLQTVLGELPGVLRRPVANLERIAVLKHDGELVEPLPTADDEPPVWMSLRVFTRAPTTLTRELRRAGGAAVTTLRGEWGFSGDERPFGDRFATLASHLPTETVLVDRPRRIAELWPLVDEITSRHGVVTAALVQRA